MPTDWTDKVRAAITNLEIKTDRVLEPDQALAIIDDVVEGKFAAGDLATIHGVPQAWIKTALGHITRVTRAVGTGRVRSLATGDCGRRRCHLYFARGVTFLSCADRSRDRSARAAQDVDIAASRRRCAGTHRHRFVP